MSPFCDVGQVGVPKPNTQEYVVLGGGLVAGWLETLGFPVGTTLAAVLGSLTYHLTVFCPAGPIPVAAMDAGELAALIAVSILSPVYSPALDKLRDYIDNFAWYQLCQCSAGTQPTFTAPPAVPTTVSTSPSGTAGTCTTGTASGFWKPGDGEHLLTDKLTFGTWQHATLTTGSYPGDGTLIVPNLLSDLLLTSTLDAGPLSDNVFTGLAFLDSTGTYISSIASFQTAGTTHTYCIGPTGGSCSNHWPAGTKYLGLYRGSVSGAGEHTITYTLEERGNCQGGSFSPCCATSDPTTLAALVALRQQVDLIQRQLVPFASIDGPSHLALSGSGEFSVQGILALNVAITTLPSFLGETSGDPETLYDVGWVRFGTTEGWTERTRITSNPAIITPPYAGLWTKVGYTLGPSVVANMLEILREK